jgi:hypothetical protein
MALLGARLAALLAAFLFSVLTLQTHFRNNQIHHHPFRVLARPVLDVLWPKEAALLGVLLQELGRDETVRLRWLTWFDAECDHHQSIDPT